MIEKLLIMLQLAKQKLKPLGLFLFYVYIFIFALSCAGFCYGIIHFISMCLPMYARASTSFTQIISFILLSFFIAKIVWRESLNLVDFNKHVRLEMAGDDGFDTQKNKPSNVVYLSSIDKK